ncbi:MAG: ABC transporter permease [Chitinophagaceae bacterium]
MFKNLFKIIVRNLWRYKVYTLINIAGLGIGIAALVWGYQTLRFSLSFDNFHKNRDIVYRALTYKEGGEAVKGIFPMAAVKQAQNDFSGITEVVRLDSRGLNIKYDKEEAFAEQVHFTDQSFFSLFNFPLVAGTNDINDKSAVLITERIAQKYFGNQNPLGKTLIFYSGETYAMPLTVKGVLKELPFNSTIQFDFISNFENQLKANGSKIDPDDWSWFSGAAFFKIPNAGDAARLAKEFNKYISIQNKAREDWKASGFKLITLNQNASIRDLDSNNLYTRPDDSATYGPIILAFLIFLSACLNFSNTTVSRANRRLKEIGMRKVMGSTYRQLIQQLLFECAFIVLGAMLLSVFFNQLWFPVFNGMFGGLKISADYFHDVKLLTFLAAVLVGTTFLAGAYPAFYISRFNPSTIFRGTVKFGGTNLFSRIMLGLQLSIAIITVIAGIGFAQNAEFQKNYDFGYNVQNTMGVLISDTSAFNTFKNEVATIPEVTAIAGTRNHIGFGYRKVVADAEGVKKETNYLEVGRDYLKTMNLKMVQGREFDADMEGDYVSSILITQKMAAIYGWQDKEALGKQIHIDSTNYSVVGVLKDFHSFNFFESLEPVVMKLAKENRFQFLVIQAKASDLANVFGKTRDAWKKVFPMKPYTGFYQNQVSNEALQVSTGIARIFSWFAIISILLTATGFFALVSLTVLKKMKEIALRKVVGASSGHILVLVNKGYFWIFIIAAGLGCYAGWSLTSLMMNMIFKINPGISSSTIIGSVAVLFMVAAGTTGIKVWQAVRTNPVKLLRTE